jgi:hypothetical protein
MPKGPGAETDQQSSGNEGLVAVSRPEASGRVFVVHGRKEAPREAVARWWFRQSLPVAQLRRQRRATRRRAVLLGLVAYLAHQTLVVLLDPRFSLELLIGRRRVSGAIITALDRLELAWALTWVAIGYVVLAWLLWRSASVPGLVSSDALPAGYSPLEDPLAPLIATPPMTAVEPLPRDPVTGRVVRQFDL